MVLKVWEVIGGARSGGIVVREGQKLSSEEVPERLAVGALIQEVTLVGERLQFKLIFGKGPAAGWVSLKLKGQDLVAEYPEPPAKMSGGPEDFGDKLIQVEHWDYHHTISWADAMGQVIPDLQYESPHKDDPQWKMDLKMAFAEEYMATKASVEDNLGKWKCLVPATAPAFSGPMHVLCLCLAETGHLTPLLRIARACCSRETVGRVSFVTNTFGGSKVAKWLQSDPEPNGKLSLYAFEDGWTESLQTQCNFFAQNEDGSLMGLSNSGISKYCAACVQELVCGKLPVSCCIQDMASQGYTPWLQAGAQHKKKGPRFQETPLITSAPATILGAFLFKNFGPTLIHCFMAPQLAPLVKMMEGIEGDIESVMHGKAPPPVASNVAELMASEVDLPPNVRAVGIIADEAKADKLPQHLVDFLERPGPVVYVSMGSVAAFSEEQLLKVIEGLKAPGEWRVIWSLRQQQQDLLPKGTLEALGDDFLVSSWLPQAELLQHKKVVAFMSHCGWGATCEAIISGTPVLCFPMFADQNANAMLMNIIGMAKTVTLPTFQLNLVDPESNGKQLTPMMDVSKGLRDNFTSDGLRQDLRDVLADKKFTTGAKQARTMNRMYKGGAGKAAEEVENIAYLLNPNIKR